MQMNGKVKVIVLPYKTFKERIRLTKRYERNYVIENMGQFLYMVRRS
ncbi:hypothetical protein [Clostridium botulinum]|nr:hypothetical protein [Clostridium botulinum]MBY6829227.1 hypothetical protein [Clostridium botulinum]MBY6844851.1 hypothetical protein [Clostridium botulinum]MBY6941475.1 hypothetical protein [Clostridium botulinum]MBY6962346.1 hypothetical protein [Clostridium botulinum]MBY6997554.1 hypothetical protein [Clostridium botulinum]